MAQQQYQARDTNTSQVASCTRVNIQYDDKIQDVLSDNQNAIILKKVEFGFIFVVVCIT